MRLGERKMGGGGGESSLQVSQRGRWCNQFYQRCCHCSVTFTVFKTVIGIQKQCNSDTHQRQQTGAHKNTKNIRLHFRSHAPSNYNVHVPICSNTQCHKPQHHTTSTCIVLKWFSSGSSGSSNDGSRGFSVDKPKGINFHWHFDQSSSGLKSLA